MIKAVDFLRKMSEFYKVTPARQQIVYAERCDTSLSDDKVLLIEADGGIGKTLGYLVPAMLKSLETGKPIIVATSTITNRDQIIAEYNKIIDFAKAIDHPLKNVSLVNYNSINDYASEERVTNLIERLEKTNISREVIGELKDIQTVLQNAQNDEDRLLDTVMPADIMWGEKVVVRRDEIAGQMSDESTQIFYKKRHSRRKKALQSQTVFLTTHVMLTISRAIISAIRKKKVAAVIVDEVDKLTGLDFIMRTSLRMDDVESLLSRAENLGLDTEAAQKSYDKLKNDIQKVKAQARGDTMVILNHISAGQHNVSAIFNDVKELGEALEEMANQFDAMNIDGLEWDTEVSYRVLDMELDEIFGHVNRLFAYIRPPVGTEALYWSDLTQYRLFVTWVSRGDEIKSAAATPGRIMSWLFHAGQRKDDEPDGVPVILTTAFIADNQKWFATQIGLPYKRMHSLSDADPIRTNKYGKLNFVYFSNLQAPIDPATKKPNEEHLKDVATVIKDSYVAGKRILVLSPGYHDINVISHYLATINLPIPIFAQKRHTNIKSLVNQFRESKAGGVMLTVYWEGFNIVGDQKEQGQRRGIVDIVVISRLPYASPNYELEKLYGHLNLKPAILMNINHTNVVRRVHQGLMRAIRGPNDEAKVFIMDDRFPPIEHLIGTLKHGRPGYRRLIEAIPKRFRDHDQLFSVERIRRDV